MRDYKAYIQAYKEGKLQGEMLKKFEEEMRTNTTLAEAVHTQGLDDVMDGLIENDIRQQIDQVTRQQSSKKKNGKKRSIFKLASAASILILIGFLAFVFTKSNASSQIIEEFYRPPISETVRSNQPVQGPSLSIQYEAAHLLFQEKDYASALLQFQALQGNVKYKQQAEWFEILSLIGDGQNSKAKALLQTNILSAPNHMYAEKAQALKKRLR